MKKLIIAAAALLVTVATYGQGQVNFNNRVTGVVDARVVDSAGVGVGAGWTAQLFGGPAGTAVGQLTALTPTTSFRTSSAAALGYVNGVTVDVPGVASGAQATLVMRAYQGASFATATAKGESAPFTVALGGGTLPPSNLVGLTGPITVSGAVIVPEIPEPSTLALGALGVGAALMLRRRK